MVRYMGIGKYILAFIFLSIIILFHELGHFALAKKNDIKVKEFCLGLGPTIVGIQRGETKFSIKALPFGGACIMEGEDGESKDNRSFGSKSVPARISVVAAGPVFNFLMAFIFSVVVLGSVGVAKPVIYDVIDSYPAQEAGLQSGDEITKLNHKNIHFYSEITMYTLFHAGEDIVVTYERDGEEYTAYIEPQYSEDEGRYLVGISGAMGNERLGPLETLQYSAYYVKYWIQYTVGSLKMLVTGQASLNDMSGPVGIVKSIGDTYEEGASYGIGYGLLSILNFSILISANLGIINLLPLPALDGGRLVFLIIEAIRRKKVKPEREGMVHFIGMMCLFAFMIVVVVSDVSKLV